MYHEVFEFSDADMQFDNCMLDHEDMMTIAAQFSQIYFDKGHQVVYAVHRSQKYGCLLQTFPDPNDYFANYYYFVKRQ